MRSRCSRCWWFRARRCFALVVLPVEGCMVMVVMRHAAGAGVEWGTSHGALYIDRCQDAELGAASSDAELWTEPHDRPLLLRRYTESGRTSIQQCTSAVCWGKPEYCGYSPAVPAHGAPSSSVLRIYLCGTHTEYMVWVPRSPHPCIVFIPPSLPPPFNPIRRRRFSVSPFRSSDGEMLHHQRAVGVLRVVEGAHAARVCQHRQKSAGQVRLGQAWRDRLTDGLGFG